MSQKSDIFLSKVLGKDFMESLTKTELWKPGTKSVNDIEDMRIGLKIVPRTILSFLVKELSGMEIGQTKESKIPVQGDALLKVTKHERDQFSGEIYQDNKNIVDFKFRSIPGIGLVIMSAFELYDTEELEKPSNVEENIELKVQKMIDERIALHDLVNKVVEKKMAEKEAIHNMMLMKLTEELKKEKEEAEKARLQLAAAGVAAMGVPVDLNPGDHAHSASLDDVKRLHDEKERLRDKIENIEEIKKSRPLATFMAKRQKSKEFSFQMAKGEEVICPDCRKNIFDGKAFSGCICLGQDMDRKVFIKKSEDGIKVRFSRGWDPENIEMLLELLRKK